MADLTRKMCEILFKAASEHARINNVPLAAMDGLEQRGLVPGRWRQRIAGSPCSCGWWDL